MSIDFPRDPYHGQIFKSAATDCTYYYDNNRRSWIFRQSGTAGDGPGATVYVSKEMPQPEESFEGVLWVELPWYFLYVFHNNAWVGLTNNAEGYQWVYSGDTPPSGAGANTLWFDTVNSDLRILYKDNDSEQWVTISSSDLSKVIVSDSLDKLESEMNALTVRIENLESNPQLIIE